MSQQYRTSQQQQLGRTKKKEEDPDAFMRLPDDEIAGCISDIGVPCTPADLRKPNPQSVQTIFEHLYDLLMTTTRDSIDPAMRAAADDVCGENPETVPHDVRCLTAFFVSLRRLLVECGVHDFSFNDLFRPTHERLVKVLSYIINFVRFRESQTNKIDENINRGEAVRTRIESLYLDNQDMEQRLEEMKRNRKALAAAEQEKEKRNRELIERLRELKKGHPRIAEQLERSKAERAKSQGMLEERIEKLVRSRQESEKLRPYVLQSPAALQNALQELSDNLQRDRNQIDMLERRNRALQTSADTFAVVQNDVQSCVKVLEEVAVELQKEDEEEARLAKNRDALNERSNSVREVEQSEKLLRRQLNKWEERTEELRRKQRERDEVYKNKMQELRSVQKQLGEERAEKGRDMERKRVRVEQTEKKMADLKDTIESEVHSSHEEYLKLESHIKLYITEMEQSI